MIKIKRIKSFIELGIIIFLFLLSLYFIGYYMYEQKMYDYILCKISGWFSNENSGGSNETLKGNGINELFVGFGALFTFLAFFWQYLANRRQDEIHEKQSASYSEEKAQAFFMQLIGILRENTSAICIGNGICDKYAFHYMFYEFTCISAILKDKVTSMNVCIDEGRLLAMSYSVFVNGVYKMDDPSKRIIDQNSLVKRTAKDLEIPLNLINDVLEILYKLQVNATDNDCEKYFFLNQYKKYREDILFFDGHRLRLSHITKMLMEVIRYICSEKYLCRNKDYYFRLVGCQMSDHELFIFILHYKYMYIMKEQDEISSEIKNGLDVMLRNMDQYMLSKLVDMNLLDNDFHLK